MTNNNNISNLLYDFCVWNNNQDNIKNRHEKYRQLVENENNYSSNEEQQAFQNLIKSKENDNSPMDIKQKINRYAVERKPFIDGLIKSE